MKPVILAVLVCLAACNNNAKHELVTSIDSDKILPAEKVSQKDSPVTRITNDTISTASPTYSNKRFKDVTVTKQDDSTYLVKGKAQVFEAAFAWVIEDGHEELQKGFAMADAGAPEWGRFSIAVHAKKKRSGSALHLILFESSPKDGSRQYQLPIVLEQ